ncbi:hypothetical protein [Magnetovibrio blakemorei]|uniref:Secreted protein n=1 Tax=Magnetovibrio blakemorei TaxID=28181 RepID=A0A1E5QAY4_9PROT|nr:hypothetical protein [Magnetovibrio blakemorei]OEJ69196.1 hypothetical protein BEN30_03635 [Magnetovibrio blakemorei]
MNVIFTLLVFLAVAVFGTLSFADADPNRPTDRVAVDLGVSEAQFKGCFLPVHPEPNKYPTGVQQRQNKAILLPCLQQANPSITNDMLDRVMDKYRPEGAFRQ